MQEVATSQACQSDLAIDSKLPGVARPSLRFRKPFRASGNYRLHNSSRMTIMTIVTITSLLNGEKFIMGVRTWTVAEAKAKFSEVIERAMSEGPQTITRNGRTAAVLVGAEEWQRKTNRAGNLAEFFAASPLRGSGLKMRRLKARPHKISL